MVDIAISELSCRICLVQCGPNDVDAATLADDYKTCVGFEITEEDGALKLCQICMAELSLVKRFHDKCQASELRLIKFRAENWARLQELDGIVDEPLIPINYNPNEMDITVMPLQVSMHVGGADEPPPVKRGRGRPKKLKPAAPSDGSCSSGSWWNQGQAVQSSKRRRMETGFDEWNQPRSQGGDPLPFPPPYNNDHLANNLQFLNSNDKQHLFNQAATMNHHPQQQHHHHHHKAAGGHSPVGIVPFFCGICNRRFPFKTQHEVQLHMKMHYGSAGDNPFTPLGDPFTMGEFNQFDPRMHHFVYPNKFTQHPKQYRDHQRIAK